MEDFWALNFQLPNSHLFQQKAIPAWHDNCKQISANVLQIVIETVY